MIADIYKTRVTTRGNGESAVGLEDGLRRQRRKCRTTSEARHEDHRHPRRPHWHLAACHEIPQDAVKPYAGKEDTKAYAGDTFKGDKMAYEKALDQRAQFQNDVRLRPAKRLKSK